MSMSKGFNESGVVLGLCLAIFVSWLTIYGLLLVTLSRYTAIAALRPPLHYAEVCMLVAGH